MDKDQLNRIESKVDKLDERLDRVDTTLSAQHVTLLDHTRRSEANEAGLSTLKEELKPVLTHVAVVNFLGKIALAILGSGIVVEIVKFLIKR